jgi:hypothetical protein
MLLKQMDLAQDHRSAALLDLEPSYRWSAQVHDPDLGLAIDAAEPTLRPPIPIGACRQVGARRRNVQVASERSIAQLSGP